MFNLNLLITLVTVNGVFGSSPSYNGLGLTPQMGWDNWNTFACNVSEDLLLNTADRISDIGLKDLGYKYVILDDCWSSGRDADGFLVADKQKFPNGMGHVADRLHNNSFLLVCTHLQASTPVLGILGLWAVKRRMLSSLPTIG